MIHYDEKKIEKIFPPLLDEIMVIFNLTKDNKMVSME